MNSRTTRWLATLALCGLGLFTFGCGGKQIPIGAVLPLTGDDDVYGIPVKNGIELAYEEIQADGAPLALEIVDSGSDPETAKELLRRQYDDRNALLVLGGVTSAEAREMIAVADDFDKVLLSPSASAPELSGLSRNFYRIFPSDFAAAGRMAQFVSQDLKIDEVVVIAEERQEYAKGIQGAFQSAYQGYGGSVVETLEFPPNTSDFSGFVERVMTLNPKAVYITAYGEAVGQIIQGIRSRDYKGKILTTSAFASPRFIAPAGEAANGVILTQSVFELDSDFVHIKTFVDKYKERYGEDPDIFAAHGYDAMKVIAAAVVGRPALPSEVPKGLRDIKDFPGVTGGIQFNDKGDVLKYPRVYIIKDGVLFDYGKLVQQQQEAMKEKREELRRKLEEIQRRAKEIGG
jgi:branched-chain amino acid transport system substrate-binding protein